MLKRFGDDLFSIAVDSPSRAQALAEQLRKEARWPEVVAGIDSVVVRFDIATTDATTTAEAIGEILEHGIEPLRATEALVEIPVLYGGVHGPDLEGLARKLSLSEEEIVEIHTGQEYVVDMVGFTPGFAFIGGLDERLRVPRRKEPRQHVPAGSIAIADDRTGIYALASPGGWTIIGRTSHTLFNPDADDPLVLKAGTPVRFVEAPS